MRKNRNKFTPKHFAELLVLCGIAMLLVSAALFIATGGIGKAGHFLAANHILPNSQAGCVFHCNSTAFDMEELVPMQNGVISTSVQPGTSVNWIWNAGTYGANVYNPVCVGSSFGSQYMCTVQQGSANTNFTCGAPTCPGGFDGQGNCIGGYFYPNCGNADDAYGHNYYGASGGYPPNYSYPGYDGNTTGSLVLTAPSTPGTYQYWFCSNYLLHANAYNSNLTSLPCLETDLTVGGTDNCPANPTAITGGIQLLAGTYHIVAQGSDFCITNNSGKTLFVPTNTATEVNNFKAATQGYLSGSVVYFARTSGY